MKRYERTSVLTEDRHVLHAINTNGSTTNDVHSFLRHLLPPSGVLTDKLGEQCANSYPLILASTLV